MDFKIFSFGIVFFNLSVGERVVLVKIGWGDFMIIVGKWFGFFLGKEGVIGIIFFKFFILYYDLFDCYYEFFFYYVWIVEL